MRFVLFAALAVLSFAANAAPVTWTINGAALNNGGLVTGSFDYDAVENVFSNINIVSTAYGDAFTFTDENVFFSFSCTPSACGDTEGGLCGVGVRQHQSRFRNVF